MEGFSPWGALIGAGVGLGKAELIDRPKEERQRKYAAETIRLSPWTGMDKAQAAGGIQEADPFGSALQGAGVGMQYSPSQFGMGGEAAGAEMAPMAGAPAGAPPQPVNTFGSFGQLGSFNRGHFPQPNPKAYG